MNKIKTAKYLLFIFALPIILNVVYYTGDGEAWKNGERNAYYKSVYKADFEQSHITKRSKCYGTHDWIAECAIELVYEFFPDNLFIQMLKFNTYDLKVWCLFGTEVPDTLKNNEYKEVNTGLHKFIRSSSDFPYYSLPHNEQFYSGEPEGRQASDNLEKQAGSAKDRAILMFREKDCKGAAFYLGVLFHYIADAAYDHHTIMNPNSQTLADLRAKTLYLTNKKYSDWPSDNGGSFFKIDSARIEFSSRMPSIETVMHVVYLTAFDCHYGHADLNSQDAAFRSLTHKKASWMEERNFPINAFGDKEIQNWRYNDWSALGSGDDRDYLEKVHHDLNLAVYYCAAVLNYMKNYYTDCLFIGDQIQEQLNELLIQYPLYVLLAIAGPIGTMFTVAQKISEKMLFLIYEKAISIKK